MPDALISFSWATLARKYPLSGVRSVPSMDSATWCRTPAAASAARRLRPEVWKNSSTAVSSNDGELARSITTCVPAMASLRPSPVMVLTPVLGEAATTSWPRWRRMATVFEPMRPVPVFRDIDSIPPGLDFCKHIQSSIEDSDVLMVVVGPRWTGGSRHGHPRIHAETDYVRIEVETALNRHIPVIPLLVGGADMPQPSQLPENIREFAYRNAVQIDSGRDFDHHMNGLIRATDKILLSTQTSAPAASTGLGTIEGRPFRQRSETEASTEASRQRDPGQRFHSRGWQRDDRDWSDAHRLVHAQSGERIGRRRGCADVSGCMDVRGHELRLRRAHHRHQHDGGSKLGAHRRYHPLFARGVFQPSLVQRLLRPRSAAPDVGRHRPHLAAGRGGGLSAAGPLAIARGEAVISQTTYQRNVG